MPTTWTRAIAPVALAGCLSAPPQAGEVPDGDGASDVDSTASGDAMVRDLVPSGATARSEPIGGIGGDPYEAPCPDDRLVTGLDASENGAGMTAVIARCGRFQIGPDDVVHLIDTIDGDAIEGDPDSTPLDAVECTPGLIAVGYQGTANFNDVVSQLQLLCAPILWDGQTAVAGDGVELTAGLGTEDEPAGSGACDSGEAAAGIAGRFGLLIDQFQLDCSALEVRPAP